MRSPKQRSRARPTTPCGCFSTACRRFSSTVRSVHLQVDVRPAEAGRYTHAETYMADVTLFTPGRIDGFDTRNRLVMAPMTRSRALPGGVPSELAIEYYAQRASAVLIITEGAAPCAAGLGYARTPTA